MTILQGDVLDRLRQMPDESVHCVVTDPPYNVGKNYDGYNDKLSEEEYLSWLWEVWRECGRVAKQGGFLIYTNRIRHLEHAFNPPPPWQYFHIAVWHKPLSLAGTFYGIAPHWEPIIIWSKGKPWRPFRGLDIMSDCLQANVVSGSKRKGLREHPTPRPEELYCKLITFGCPEGGTVLDPFLGSGTTGAACERLGRHWIGIELSEKYVQLAMQRTAQKGLQKADHVEEKDASA